MTETIEADVIDPQVADAAEKRTETALAVASEGKGQHIALASNDINFQNASELFKLAQAFAHNGVAPRGATAGGVMASMLKGRELGIPTVTAITSISVVNGRVQMSGALILALLKKLGIRYAYDHEGEGMSRMAWIEAWDPRSGEKRGDWPRHTFSMFDAQRAGLISKKGDIYKAWPDEMILWRAVAKMGRRQFPEVCAGIYVPGEVPGDPEPELETEEPQREAPSSSGPSPVMDLIDEVSKPVPQDFEDIEPLKLVPVDGGSDAAEQPAHPDRALTPVPGAVLVESDAPSRGEAPPEGLAPAAPFSSHAEADAAIAAQEAEPEKPACEHTSIQKHLARSTSGKAIVCPDCNDAVRPELKLKS